MKINSLRGCSPLRPAPRAGRPECPEDRFEAEQRGPGGGLVPLALVFAMGAATVALAQQAPVQDSTLRLLSGVERMRSGEVATPVYLGGGHLDWKGDTDHCYSIYFRVAIQQGLLSENQAEDLMRRMHGPEASAFLSNLFPQGYQQVPFQADRVMYGVIPAGHLISMDGGDHVMMSTGKLLANGQHEVYSFKGGGVETPVWGDSVGYDPAAKIHKTTLENELRALQGDDQPLDHVKIVEGRSALQP
jgi:hypothetical protein